MAIIQNPTISSSGGTSLNLAYGNTAPSDTSKIWIQADEPFCLDIKFSNNAIIAETLQSIALPPFSVNVSSIACGGDKVYVSNLTASEYNKLAIYDTKTNTYDNKGIVNNYTMYNNDMSNCFYYDGKLYFNYYKSSGQAYKWRTYDPTNNVGSELASKGSTSQVGAVVVGDSAYYISGSTLRKYDIIGNTDVQVWNFSYHANYTDYSADGSPIIALAGTTIYFLANMKPSSITTSSTSRIFKYDTDTGATSSYELPERTLGNNNNVRGTVGFYDGKNIYYFAPQTNTNAIWKYDCDKSFTQISTTLPTNMTSPKVAIVNGIAYIFNGQTGYKFFTSFAIEHGKGELYLGSGDGSSKGHIINSDTVKQEINGCQYFYGDENGKSTQAPVYYHNGTSWVRF